MRRIVAAVLILILPTATALVVYLIVNKKIPTNRQAIGVVTTIAGAGYPGVVDGPARSASFSDPFGIAVDKRGNIYVADGGQGNSIRKIKTDGKVETIAGSTEGFADGNALQAQFNTPSGIAIDKAGNILVADTSNNRIRKITPDGKVTTLAGSGAAGYKDGVATAAEFDGPIGIAVDRSGNVFVADTYNDRIRMVAADGAVITIAGTGAPGYNDGNASTAAFNTPAGIAVDEQGNIFVADTGNSAIRKITAQGEVSTIAARSLQPEGSRASAALRHPVGIVVTHDGFLFVTDASSVSKISPEGAVEAYAGKGPGFADGSSIQARFNNPSGIALDREGNLFVPDTQNYLIRHIAPAARNSFTSDGEEKQTFVQPPAEPVDRNARDVVPELSASRLNIGTTFPWPLQPQNEWHEVTGVMGEARGAPGGVALDHIHSGLDIRGNQGEPVLSVLDEKVSSPMAAWDFGGTGEGIQVALMSYIHVRVGRNERDQFQASDKFKPAVDSAGRFVGVRVRRGTRFKVGDFIGTVNRLYHVHLNLGPWNAQGNPLMLPFADLKDTTPPTIEANGIEVLNSSDVHFTERLKGSLVISGDVRIVVTAYDRVDGNGAGRKLGLYRLGYQLLDANGNPAKGFEQPMINIELNRLPADDSSVLNLYAAGSGISAYGTPTKFKYVVTNRVRDGEVRDGLLRTSDLAPGNYVIRVIAEDYAGNRASGPSTELAVTVKH